MPFVSNIQIPLKLHDWHQLNKDYISHAPTQMAAATYHAWHQPEGKLVEGLASSAMHTAQRKVGMPVPTLIMQSTIQVCPALCVLKNTASKIRKYGLVGSLFYHKDYSRCFLPSSVPINCCPLLGDGSKLSNKCGRHRRANMCTQPERSPAIMCFDERTNDVLGNRGLDIDGDFLQIFVSTNCSPKSAVIIKITTLSSIYFFGITKYTGNAQH